MKHPRVGVSNLRHRKLFLEAQKENVTVKKVVEAKLKLADRVIKDLRAAEKKA